ncbi:galactose oxidase [Hymenobacter sp. RP-2-7]|uniref:Galactose oxidase n=1 Tax=Hymenobacter polaris TaxID=2682546 RepID=A0A7Y0ADV0_9BACT|nr:kelch repeat-containing protein [Hymenobacter polaris]NML65372.1 galactose oxidase [Hymenobacter polaris]
MKNLVQRASRLLLALVLLGSFGLSSCHKDDTTTVYGNWTKGSSFPAAARRGAVSFVINNVAYVGTGIDVNGTRYNDFYSYNPTNGSYTTLTSLPAVARYYAVAFTVGNYGYVGTGYDGTNYLADFWRFDPSANTQTTLANGTTVTTVGKWTRVADLTTALGGTARYGAVAGSVGNYGYVGCGFDLNYKKDFYRYDPTSNTWSTFAGFPGDKRMGAVAFTINNQLYVGTGINNGAVNTDFWSYNPSGDTWTQKRNTANQTTGSDIYDYSAVARNNAVAFVVGNYGYIVTGSNGGAVRSDCYQYDPTMDTWTKMNPFLGTARSYAVGFGIGNYGYVGTGANGTASYDDFWRIDPSAEQQ